MSAFFIGMSWVLIVLTFPFSLIWCLKVAAEYERVVVFRLGRLLQGTKGPGIFFVLPCMDNIIRVDLRTVSCDVPTQEILTKDTVTISVDAVVFFRICDAIDSVSNIENVRHSTQLLAQTTLRNILGTKTLAEVLADREQIKSYMQENLDIATSNWGVRVERVEVKDVRLPFNLQRAMAAEAESARDARARFIRAEGEQKASRAYREAANEVAKAPNAVHLRYLQTLRKISGINSETIVMPISFDLLRFMLPNKVQKRLPWLQKGLGNFGAAKPLCSKSKYAEQIMQEPRSFQI